MKRLTRRKFLSDTAKTLACTGLLPVINGCNENKNTSKKPNVLLMVSDDQGYGDLSCFNNEYLKTPNLDSLFNQGARLTNYINSPLCAPTRASLMTGRYNYRTGVWDTWMGRLGLHEDEVTLGDYFNEAGYSTGLFGKWHLGENPPALPRDNGFQESLRLVGGDRFDPTMIKNGKTKKMKGYFDDIIFGHAIDFVEKNKDKPFLACVTSFLPHDGKKPQVPEEYIEPFRDIEGLKPGDQEVYAMVAKLDQNIGRMLKKLEELDLDRETVVIFMSDNGPLKLCPDLVSNPEILACKRHDYGNRYNCGLRGGKTNVYEGGIKVPCFINWPGVTKPSQKVEELSAHIDILPTLLDICNIPQKKEPEIDGISLVPYLKETDTDENDRAVFIQSHRVEVPQPWQNCTVRESRYKLINDDELYDLKNDPGEENNIADEKPGILARLKKRYEKWFADVTKNDPFRPGITYIGYPENPDVRFNIYHHHPKGWPVKVFDKGPYKIKITGIQNQLFSDSSKMCLKIGDKVLEQKISKDKDHLVFDNVKMAKGKYIMDIWPEGPRKPAKMYYGNEDFGYRDIIIELKK